MENRFAGPHAFVLSLSGRLKEEGIETTVVAPQNSSKYFIKKLKENDIKVRLLDLHALTKVRFQLIKYFIFFIPELISLYKFIKKSGVDIVHCNHSWQFKGPIAGKLTGKRVVWTLHETKMPAFINAIFKFLALNFCDGIITAGEAVKKYYLTDEKFLKKKVLLVEAPVDTSVFDPSKSKEDPKMAQYHGLKVIAVCNINPAKGIEYFIEMAAILNRRYSNISFIIVGQIFDSRKIYSNKLFDLVDKLQIKNLFFYGFSSDISSVIKAADIYVCSSITEASPMSVWEAMSMRKAIVSTDVGDVAKFIKDGVSGYIVPIKNALAMAEKAGLLIENADLRKRFGINARKIA